MYVHPDRDCRGPESVTPYYQDAHSTIWLGDCREVIREVIDPVDLMVTDPPYGIGEANGKNKSRSKLAIARDYGADDWDDEPPSDDLISEIRELGRDQIIFGGNFFRLPPASCWLVWDKMNGASDFADAELAWTNLKKAVRLKRYRWAGMLQQHMGDEKETRYHPTQKPVQIMTWAISQCPTPPTSILDPFMGSGTTLIAAKQLGIRAIGIEREEKYCAAAVRRLAQGTLAL